MKVETIDAQVFERCINAESPYKESIGICNRHAETMRQCHDLRRASVEPHAADADLCIVSTAIKKACTKHKKMIRECAGLEHSTMPPTEATLTKAQAEIGTECYGNYRQHIAGFGEDSPTWPELTADRQFQWAMIGFQTALFAQRNGWIKA